MNIKQLKADYQLAELRAKSNNSEANQTILKQTKKAYEAALKPVQSESEKAVEKVQKEGKKQLAVLKSIGSINALISPKTENPKIDTLSGENENPETLSGTEQNGDASGDQQDLPEDTTNSGEPAEQEKKTEVIP